MRIKLIIGGFLVLAVIAIGVGVYIWKFKDPCAEFKESGIYTDTVPGNKNCVEQAMKNPYTQYLKKQATPSKFKLDYESYLQDKISKLESQVTTLQNNANTKTNTTSTETVIYQPSNSVNCTSNKIGNYVYTNCR